MSPLKLEDLRSQLIRQEETIIFAFIERAQFRVNAPIYQAGAIPVPGFTGCFSDYLLYETEKVHARVRRYTSPDEHPFFPDLPQPVLPPMAYAQRIKPNRINLNPKIHRLYHEHIVPAICGPGDCQNYGSSATCDVACLQALSKRIHYGKFIAEAKYQADPGAYEPLIRRRNAAGILARLQDAAVEQRLLDRVRLKAATYGQEPGEPNPNCKIPPPAISDIYAQWIVPLTCEVEVAYLLDRLDR